MVGRSGAVLFWFLAGATAAQERLPPLTAEQQEAARILALAEKHVQHGRYGAAVSAYRELASHFAGLPEGEVGRRRSAPSAFLGWADVVRHGPSANRADIVIMGDGYTLDHQAAFDRLADDIVPLFERQRTIREYFEYLNFLRANLVSADAGVDEYGREYDTALDGRTLGTIQGHVGVDRGRVFEMLGQMPEHDGLAVVFVRRGQHGTGGGGVATIGGRADNTVLHEFGHALAGLGDEYTAATTHRPRAPREAPNLSTTGSRDEVPWRHWLEARVPGIDVYEGAAGQVKGAFKPTTRSCMMDNGEFFCPVCREAMVLAIHRYVDPIDGCSPFGHEFHSAEQLLLASPLRFEVRVLLPRTHEPELRWYVVPEQSAPPPPQLGMSGVQDRRGRGRLGVIEQDPVKTVRFVRRPLHEFELDPGDYPPGRYRVVCRVIDTTLLPGEQWPWVLKDEWHLLASERAWWVQLGEPGKDTE